MTTFRLALVSALALVVACDSGVSDTAPTEPTTFVATAQEETAEPTSTATSPDAITPTPTESAPTTVEPTAAPTPLADPVFEEFALPAGTRPHDVAPGRDGAVWYTGQGAGLLGRLDPTTGEVVEVPLGPGSAPHGVIVGPEGDAWVTDGGRHAIQRVGAADLAVEEFPLPGNPANLNTATFDGDGRLWFTGQSGIYGSVDPASGDVAVYESPGGSGPYGIATTPDGTAWFSSLAGSYIARIDDPDGTLTTYDTPTPGGGARRIWSDSAGRLWVTEWFAGRLARFDPATESWAEWDLPVDGAQPYAVFVDDRDQVWVTDFTSDALVRFDPATEQFATFANPTAGAEVRQLLGRPGEVWGAGSAIDTVLVLRTSGDPG